MKHAVCVVGLGRIGLPIALVIASKGHIVYGVDIDPELVEELNRGQLRFFEPGLKDLFISCRGNFIPNIDLTTAVERSNVILCCVGTRKYATDRPNLKTLYNIFRDLSRADLHGKLIIVKTTVPIGTTRALSKFLAKKTKLQVDRDFCLAFSPERIVEGKAVEELQLLPSIVGAVGPESVKRVVDFYHSMDVEVVNVVSSEAAELVKLIDNSYRITRFGFANDVSLIAESLGLNAYEIIDAANFKYPRNSIPYPSCGVSGYCLTKDPAYLEVGFKRFGRNRGFDSLWMIARRAYDHTTKSVIETVLHELRKKRIGARQSRILVCGVAYKSDIDDIRDSHGLLIARLLAKKGAEVSIWDPCISANKTEFHEHQEEEIAFKGKDVAIFTVAHRQFLEMAHRIEGLTKLMRTPLVYDGAAVLRTRYRDEIPFKLIGTGLPRK